DLALVARVTNTDNPGLAQPVAEQPRVAAGIDHRVLDPETAQQIDAAIDGIALGNATEIDPHAVLEKTYRIVLAIDDDLAVVDARQGRGDGRIGRVDVLAVVVQVADACIRDVERAVAELRVLERLRDDVDDARVDDDRMVRRL